MLHQLRDPGKDAHFREIKDLQAVQFDIIGMHPSDFRVLRPDGPLPRQLGNGRGAETTTIVVFVVAKTESRDESFLGTAMVKRHCLLL